MLDAMLDAQLKIVGPTRLGKRFLEKKLVLFGITIFVLRGQPIKELNSLGLATKR